MKLITNFKQKLLSFAFLTTLSISIVPYTPAAGSLQLGDMLVQNPAYAYGYGPRMISRGLIMNSLLKDPEFNGSVQPFLNFMHVANVAQLTTYQDIVDSLMISSDSPSVARIINILEDIIMKHINMRQYAWYSQGKWSNIFATGVKFDWFYPSAWFSPSSWFQSNTSAEITQLLNELENLSEIVKIHSPTAYLRLLAKIESYRSWKYNTFKTLTGVGLLASLVYYRDNVSNFVKNLWGK